MGPPGAVDREFVYRDFVYSSSFFLLASFVLVLPSLFLHLLCCFFLLSSCFCCVGSILAHLKESCIVCFILVSSTAATRHHSPRAVSMLLSFWASEIHLTKYTYFPLSYDRFLLFYVILYCFLLCFFMLDIREILLHY